jgi:hypothetical protein
MLAAKMVAATSRDVIRLLSPPGWKLTKAVSVEREWQAKAIAGPATCGSESALPGDARECAISELSRVKVDAATARAA